MNEAETRAGSRIQRNYMISPGRIDGQGRHFNVRTEQKQIEKLRYKHRNPVECGLVDCPEQWEWSSFRSYLILGGAAVHRCDNRIILNTALAAEGTALAQKRLFRKLFSRAAGANKYAGFSP